MERVVVTGLGMITPLGLDARSSWNALLAGESGVGTITAYDPTAFRCQIAAEVKGWDPLLYTDKKKAKEMDRFTEFAVGAAAMAVKDAGLELTEEEKDTSGCIIGVGLGAYLTCKDWKAGQETGNKAALFISGVEVGKAAATSMIDLLRNGTALPPQSIANTEIVDASNWEAEGVVCT